MGNRKNRHLVVSAGLFAVVACGPAPEPLTAPEPEENAHPLPPEPVVTFRGSDVSEGESRARRIDNRRR